MKTNIIGRKLIIKDSFRELAEKKLQKVGKFFGDEAEATVTVTPEKNHAVVELMVRSEGLLFRAEECTAAKEDALDSVVDSIIRQIRKNKTKVERRIHMTVPEEAVLEAVEEEPEFHVARSKKVGLHPMDVEEAILQMNLLNHDFFLFRNAETGLVNVVYQRNKGDYGLLEPYDE